MNPVELLRYVVEVLDSAGIEYMVTGSVASSLHGEPRATHDLDIVVAIRPAAAPALLKAFSPPQFYLDEGAILEAIQIGGMFNAINVEEGDKVDFWLLTDDPFDVSRFSRRVQEDVFGIPLKVSSPEDTILAKLRWSKLSGGSAKPYIDALRVYEVQAHLLDLEYLSDWAQRLDVTEAWQRIQDEAELPS